MVMLGLAWLAASLLGVDGIKIGLALSLDLSLAALVGEALTVGLLLGPRAGLVGHVVRK